MEGFERKLGIRNLGPMSPPVALIGNDLLVRGRVPLCVLRSGCDLVATFGRIGGAAPCMQDPPAADRRKPRAPFADVSILTVAELKG